MVQTCFKGISMLCNFLWRKFLLEHLRQILSLSPDSRDALKQESRCSIVKTLLDLVYFKPWLDIQSRNTPPAYFKMVSTDADISLTREQLF